MNRELQENLYKKYPKIFVQKNILSPARSCMSWGITTADGWYWLIDNLCMCIQNYVDAHSKHGVPQIEAIQVKEKFGGLRFYYEPIATRVDGMIILTEQMSYNCCEDCGSTKNIGITRGAWIHTCCKECANEHNYRTWSEHGRTEVGA